MVELLACADNVGVVEVVDKMEVYHAHAVACKVAVAGKGGVEGGGTADDQLSVHLSVLLSGNSVDDGHQIGFEEVHAKRQRSAFALAFAFAFALVLTCVIVCMPHY